MAPVPSTSVSVSLERRIQVRKVSSSFNRLFSPAAAAAETPTSTAKNTSSTASSTSSARSGSALPGPASSGRTACTITTLPSPHSSENCGQIYPPMLPLRCE